LAIIDYLARRSLAIGIDAGNNGLMVCQALTGGLDKYRLTDKIIPIAFGGRTEIAPGVLQDNKKFMTDLLNQAIADKKWKIAGIAIGGAAECVFADTKKESQFSRQTYSNTQGGKTVYSKGNDHIIDADRCAAYAEWHYRVNGHAALPSSLPPPSVYYDNSALRGFV